ncbi:MAG TPA: hypothetical protein VD994_02775, partial [Prosthecobacter sp.]|nr:hypothetical protein [Prosthecobacter sp.]
LSVLGGSYQKPPTGQVVLGLTDDGATPNAELVFSDGGLTGPAPDVPAPAAMAGDLNQTFRISKTTNAVVMPTGAANPAQVKVTSLNASTGAFAGSFALGGDADPTKQGNLLTRKVTFKGLLIPRAGFNRGAGYFLMPKLPQAGPPPTTLTTSPVLSGRVRLLPAE